MKVAFDTNILVRFIINDDAKMVSTALALINRHGHKEIFISTGALLETFYVLRSVYGLSKEQVLIKIEDLLRIEQFNFEHEIPIRLALAKSSKGTGFYDALIGEIGA